MQTLEDVTRKISKLLKMAQGGTEEEAKAAMDKALQIASENGLDMATAAIMGEEKAETLNEPVDEKTVVDDGSKLKITDNFIHQILQNHFNISIIYNNIRGRRQTRVNFIGTNTNIEIAKEIYTRLSQIFQYSWLSYKERTGAATTDKRIYFTGMTTGIEEVLRTTKRQMIDRRIEMLPSFIDREKAESEYQLILSTPQKRNEDYKAMKYKKLGTHSVASCGYNPNVYRDGINDGRAVDVEGNRKALTA